MVFLKIREAYVKVTPCLLTLIIKRRVQENGNFEYHTKCDKMKIINLCFADDLFMFSRGKTSSVYWNLNTY